MSLRDRAQRAMPGGVTSPEQAFPEAAGSPVFARAAAGAYLVGEDGKRYIDYLGGYGPHILGHGETSVVNAIAKALKDGTSLGAPTLAEVELAERLIAALPGVEMVRYATSGTEANMAALRLARVATGRRAFLRFLGCDHGHGDAFVDDGPAAREERLEAPYNDLATASAVFAEHGERIAAVFVEPVPSHMGLVLPRPGFLEGLRALCDRHGTLLVFDEVATGFRVAWGGAQVLAGVVPDLTTLGRVIGGGLPLAAYVGPRALMQLVSPEGPVAHSGSFAANRLAIAAGLATLDRLAEDHGAVYQQLEELGLALEIGLVEAALAHSAPLVVHRQGSMLSLFFHLGPVHGWSEAAASDRALYARVFHALLGEGVHLPPSPFEPLLLSAAHGTEEVTKTLHAFDRALDRALVNGSA